MMYRFLAALFLLFICKEAEAIPNYTSIAEQIAVVLKTNRVIWPMDVVPNNPSASSYGPLMVRLAWHCSGTYRVSDGRGGCEGARIRFDPERSWADNVNLDKALDILKPIKLQNPEISWGDLIVLAGNTALSEMGTPVLGFCGGRVDDMDGSASIALGPSSEQERLSPCAVNGECQPPFGTSTVGLIYVNAEGPMGNPDPVLSVPDLRDTFTRMGMDDFEGVALMGGGHTFGKAHGACLSGPGPNPDESPDNPYPGTCEVFPDPVGKGRNTFSLGFEGSWTTNPTIWTDDYITNLLNLQFEKVMGPGGHFQWRPVTGEPIMMLTTDIALTKDSSYMEQLQTFSDFPTFGDAFQRVWYKLTTLDMGPVTRCIGPLVPPPQPFQNPLPPSQPLPDFSIVRKLIQTSLFAPITSTAVPADVVNGQFYYGALFVQLAWNCANTFRATDHRGGCNGATIRFDPQLSWDVNVGMAPILKYLRDNVFNKYSGPGVLSMADTIVLAGQVALENAGAPQMKFCGGRVDAPDGSAAKGLQPRVYPNAFVEAYDNMEVMGLTFREFVALKAMLRSPFYQKQLGFDGSWSNGPNVFSPSYFKVLLGRKFNFDGKQFVSKQGNFMMPSDIAIKFLPEFLAVAEMYFDVLNVDMLKSDFTSAWTKMMNADRFNGPTGNLCA